MVSAPVPAVPVTQPDTTDASRTVVGYREGHDTTFYIGRQQYRLLLRAETDSTQPLVTTTEGIVGPAFADDTSTFAQTKRVRGYAGRQIITLLDPNGRQVFRRVLHKPDFYSVANRDIITVSEPARPVFVGYQAATQTLGFTLDIGIPYSDVWQRCLILLGFDGRVKQLATSYWSNWDAPDCAPRLLPDGEVLTCQELLLPNKQRVSLLKPPAQLLAAFMLTDTTLCTVYRYGQYRNQPAAAAGMSDEEELSADFQGPEWVADKRRQSSPNAFVINARGQVRHSFQYHGYREQIGFWVPRRYLWQTHTYYLLDEERGLTALDKHNAKSIATISFKEMQPFQPPRLPGEVRFQMKTEGHDFTFYVDPTQPRRLRYQRRPHRDD
ncbi:hypothetical protein HER32_10680 [Hymenobacter sp. BT18]|uniref:hypothetical protein n=1 Tax=Hymenobacter sp. BT18 TaxID=2835648 RepID=UPI00143E7D75|nr:hypothetical protein [Hymenobacter sp. BT18]QIX61616.1 hypothetical protein HER32_10680 [Hymenobacter sp. BT18]